MQKDKTRTFNSTSQAKPRLISFYLPQYHPIPDNDLRWGKGFTEWRNVARAKSLFPGHYQPHVPADLGFYDLRVPETRQAQADMAKTYGIHGFCYYHYWFEGKRLLELPLSKVLAQSQPDLPFCICWANENWTRRWGGNDREILIRQGYSTQDDLQHIKSLISVFQDPRYIRVDDKPLILVYRANSLPAPAQTAEIWRDEAVRVGLAGLYLCTVTSLPKLFFDPALIGFDAAVDFQPDWQVVGEIRRPLVRKILFRLTRNAFFIDRVNYRDLVSKVMQRSEPGFKLFPGVTPGWDNSPRMTGKLNPIIVTGSKPEFYGQWLRFALSKSMRNFSGDERLVFVNGWNEWGESNHLEPDQKWGRRYLEETKKAFESVITQDML
jgi:O-antigen biosynthesis protein